MKILDLLNEAKFSKQIYAYHGTYFKHLRSIIKKGLVANHSEGGYGSMGTDDMGVPLTALDGVYVTKSYDMALDAASCAYDEKQELIIVCKVQPQAFLMDEDNIDTIFRTRSIRVHTREKIKEDETFLADHEAQKAFAEKLWEEEFIYVLKNIIAEKQIKYVEKPSIEYIASVITLTCLNHTWALDPDNNELEQNSQKYHAVFKEKQMNLTKALRKIRASVLGDHNLTRDFDSFRIEGNIGFSGANKIVGITHPYTGYVWGDCTGVKGNIYRRFDTPFELLNNIEAKL